MKKLARAIVRMRRLILIAAVLLLSHIRYKKLQKGGA